MKTLTTLLCIIIFSLATLAVMIKPNFSSFLDWLCVCLLCYVDWLVISNEKL